MFPEIDVGVLAALSEGQRAIAHLVVLLTVALVVGVLLLVRRRRRADQSEEMHRVPEEQR